jgi:uncharacterized Ntn-hydrolase superfamily protein
VTFSVVAWDSAENSWGVAVASKYLAVGAMVPAAEFQAGALATQAWTNMAYRPAGLDMLRAGLDAHEVVKALLATDDEPARRQLGVVDRHGAAAAWTGSQCSAHAGDRTGDGYAIQGNLLTGPEVLDAMEAAWRASRTALPERLLHTLAAGDVAGGDRRGRQSAALYVVGPDSIGHGATVDTDLRVDDAAKPLTELTRLYALRQRLRTGS